MHARCGIIVSHVCTEVLDRARLSKRDDMMHAWRHAQDAAYIKTYRCHHSTSNDGNERIPVEITTAMWPCRMDFSLKMVN